MVPHSPSSNLNFWLIWFGFAALSSFQSWWGVISTLLEGVRRRTLITLEPKGRSCISRALQVSSQILLFCLRHKVKDVRKLEGGIKEQRKWIFAFSLAHSNSFFPPKNIFPIRRLLSASAVSCRVVTGSLSVSHTLLWQAEM